MSTSRWDKNSAENYFRPNINIDYPLPELDSGSSISQNESMACVYILTNKSNSTLYIGSTKDLPARMFQHQEKLVPGFSSRYNLNKLVHYEHCDEIEGAREREKQLKAWKREWKLELIRKTNPGFDDLSDQI